MNALADLQDRSAVDAEQAVVGALLQEAALADELAGIIAPEDFAERRHRLIAELVIAMQANGDAVDTVTVIEELSRRGELEAAGGASYIGSLARDVLTANAKTYAQRVATAAAERRMVACGRRVVELAGERARPLDARLAEAAQALDAVTPERGGPGARRLCDFMPGWIDHLDARHQAGGDISGLPTGFADLDLRLSGMQPGDLLILAGRPSMGKTALALNIANHAALRERQPTAVFSLEMMGEQLLERAVAAVGKVDAQRLRVGNLHDDEWPQVTAATGSLKDAPLFIDESARLHIDELRRRARRLHREHGLGLVVVDYLQLVRADREQRKDLEVAAISAGLKALAKELRVPVLALSQLNRDLERRPNKRPNMADLRESGAIEQDADVIAFIYRDEVYNLDSAAAGTAEIIIGKQRNGPTGTVRLTFMPEYQRFGNFLGQEPEPNLPHRYSGGFD